MADGGSVRFRVVMYVLPGCVQCRRARLFFVRNRIPFTEVNVFTHPKVLGLACLGCSRILPLITIGQRTIRVDDVEYPYFQQVFWAGTITVAYLPSTVFPTGPSRDGLPIGLQAVGAEYDDYVCIDFARLLAQEFGGFVPPPGY